MRWSETVFNKQGLVEDKYILNGVFTIEIETPKEEELLLTNPLGIFINNFQWNRERVMRKLICLFLVLIFSDVVFADGGTVDVGMSEQEKKLQSIFEKAEKESFGERQILEI